MYLKRLDLQGFKSFPEKVKLEFLEGITAVVGPNGSGKSNISDSIRWVLGEQRVKSLRGDKMEDVIFAGTSNRKPLGFAEVSITLDNEDKKISLDYTDITVTRTVYRSGESKYMINGTVCRLKDVHELFMDTGIGREGYSIIGQGRIDEILSSKSEDRRRLFEEAAGIVKFRSRRAEAISKLEKEQQNLIRVDDIINELEEKIEPLREQNEVAKKYLSLKENLKKYEISNFYIQSKDIDQLILSLLETKEISQTQLQDEKSKYEKSKTEIEQLKAEEERFLTEIEKLVENISLLATDIEKNQGEIRLLNEQIQNIDANTVRIEKDIVGKKEKIQSYEEQNKINQSKITAINVNMSTLQSRLDKKEEEFKKLSSELAQKEEEMETYKADMIEKIKITTELKSDIQRLEMMCKQFEERLEQLVKEQDYSQSQIHGTKIKIEATKKRIEQKNEEKLSITEKAQQLHKERETLLEEEKNTRDSLNNKINKFNEHKSRHKILSEMKNDFEGFYKSVKAILKLRGSDGFNGICGAVGEVIKLDQKHEVAIEIAIGGAMQNIITDNENDAKYAIEYLKKYNLGRATFLPISFIKGKDVGRDKDLIANAEGVVGIAKDLVSYEAKYENIISSILGRTIVMENMATALKLAKQTNHQYRLVTLEGDMINAGGTMTGGSAPKSATNIFARSREISELEEKIQGVSLNIKDLKEKLTDLQEKREVIKSHIGEITEKVNSINISLATLQQENEQNENILSEKEEYLKNSSNEGRVLEERILSAKEDREKLLQSFNTVQDEIDKIDKALENSQDTTQAEKNTRDNMVHAITEIKVSISALNQETTGVLENVNRILGEIKGIETEIEELNIEKEDLKEEKLLKQKKLKEIDIELEQIRTNYGNFEKLKGETQGKVQLVKTKINEAETNRQSYFETITNLENNIFKIETRLEKLNEDKNRMHNQIWEEYEITFQQAKSLFDESLTLSEISSKTKELKQEIKNLGDVNVNAIEEYKTVGERYEFLKLQRDDIKDAEEKLMKIIDDLGVLMREQFKEQFELISKNFNSVFREMFGGGQAYLKIADETDILESGIDIIAQPPGKNLQSMMLLSGGERALTAIAILFAILKMKPSPFCVLDEIEAALDDANVKRFANYLHNFSGGTQFIVITHRKGTMEVADVMYGVTMQEQGISKVISVKFDEMATLQK